MKRWNDLDIVESVLDAIDPKRTALLVYDMQAGICSQVKSAGEITQRCVALLEAARATGMRVVYTRHLSAPKPWMGASAIRMGMAWQRTNEPDAVRPWFLRDSEPFHIVPELLPRADELVLDKLAMSAFEGTPLATAMRDCGLTSLIICGIATEIGIDPTVRHAADLGLISIVVTDACGAGHHEAGVRSIESLRFAGDALFATTDETIAAMTSRNAGTDQ